MKKLLILFLFLPVAVQAQQLLKQQIRLQRSSGTVAEMLSAVHALPGINLSYSSGTIDLQRHITLSGRERTLEDYLRSILKGQQVKILEKEGKIFLLPDAPLKRKTISGYVMDMNSGERLIGASVYTGSGTRGTATNAYGFYSLSPEEDSIILHVSYSGYKPWSAVMQLAGDTFQHIRMEPVIHMVENVIVRTERNAEHNRTGGKISVSPAFIRSMPPLMGEADVLKSLQMLPGVQGGNEGSSGLNVRGGSPDQNLILLDGVPVYNASHMFSLFSVFNADAVNHVEMLKGAFPANYGGRLSSVVDVHMKEGDQNLFHGEGGIGSLFSKITLEGPVKKGRSSFMVSGRRTYYDLFLNTLSALTSSQMKITPYFMDLNAKVNFNAGKKDRFYLSIYSGKDLFRVKDNYSIENDTSRYTLEYNSGFSWGNITAMGRWNHVYSSRLFSNLTMNFSRYRFNTHNNETRSLNSKGTVLDSRQHYFSGIRDWNIRWDFDYFPAPGHSVRAGFSATSHQYMPGINRIYLRDSIERINTVIDYLSTTGNEYDLYVQDDFRIGGKIKLNAGLRLSGFFVGGRSFYSLQPRLNGLYRMGKHWSIKASAGQMNQFIHLVANSNLGLPTDLWLPVTPDVPPQMSRQFTAGLFFNRQDFEASAEIYYKTMHNVIEYAEGAGFWSAYATWEEMVESGKGTSYGMEWMLRKKTGKITGLLCYTLGKSERQFDNINNGKLFPYKYDRRHEVKTAMAWKPSAGFELGGSWIYSTGTAISLPVAFFYDPASHVYIDIYEGRNNYRMPDYHRLDLSMKLIRQKKRYTRTWVFSIYNAYNRFNPFFRYKELSADNRFVFRDMALFPVLPSFSYQFKF